MTSTNVFVGLNEEKNSSKVLKPPGGGSSDIFGADNPMTPRSIKNRMESNIFSAPKTTEPAKNGTGGRGKPNNSHNRLFGEPDRQFTPSKNHMKSSIPIGGQVNGSNGDAAAHTNGHTNGNGVAKTNGHNGNHHNGAGSPTSSSASSTNGDHVDYQNGTAARVRDNGNPVTGEGYKAEINTTVPTLNGSNQVINKNRIPPGGFSSGLW